MTLQRIKAIYRDCYNLHAAKLAELGHVDPGIFWDDFSDRAAHIEAQHPDDELTRAFILAIHADLEAQEDKKGAENNGMVSRRCCQP